MTGGYGGFELGRALRALREATTPKLNQLNVVARTSLSQAQLSRIERGAAVPTEDDVAALLALYGADTEQRDRLLVMARDLKAGVKDKRLVVQRGKTPAMQARWRRMEDEADLVREYHPTLVAGSLQTAAYASVVMDAPADSPQVRERLARHHVLLTRARPRFRLIQTEGALRFGVGSAQVMAEQIATIIEASRRPNVEYGLIPFGRFVDVTPAVGFSIYDVRDERTVVVSLEIAAAPLVDDEDVAEFEALFERIAAVAVWGEDARVELRRILAETT